MVKNGHPVRFMHEGCSVNIETGIKCARGCNVIHQLVYWNFTKETAKKIATLTETKTVFDKD